MSRPVFIVGPSRSGTELVRSILNQSGSIHISNETHYFDDLRPRLKHPEAAGDAEDARLVAAYFKALGQHAYGLHRLPEDQDEDGRASNSPACRPDGSQAGPEVPLAADRVFEAYCKSKSPGGQRRWGEKTPRHVFRLDDIRRAFPSARVIFCYRDPRGVVASYRDWKNRWFDEQALAALDEETKLRIKGEEERVRRSYSLLVQCLMWNGAVRSALAAQSRHGDDFIHFLKFEDVLGNSRPTIETLCAWLDIPYAEEMLAVSMKNSSYTAAETVHGIVREPDCMTTAKLAA